MCLAYAGATEAKQAGQHSQHHAECSQTKHRQPESSTAHLSLPFVQHAPQLRPRVRQHPLRHVGALLLVVLDRPQVGLPQALAAAADAAAAGALREEGGDGQRGVARLEAAAGACVCVLVGSAAGSCTCEHLLDTATAVSFAWHDLRQQGRALRVL